jgi:hypothetical protein
MARYIGKLGTAAVGLTIITKLDTGQKLSHLAYNVSHIPEGGELNSENFKIRNTDEKIN